MKWSLMMALIAASAGCAGSESHFSKYSRAATAGDCSSETVAYLSGHGIVCGPTDATAASVAEYLESLGLVVDQEPALCAANETCDDGLDNDCDGQIDEDCSAKPCVAPTDCPSGQQCTPVGADNLCLQCPTQETCEDGLDNNCDGHIDEGCGGTPCTTINDCPAGQECIPTGAQSLCTQCGSEEVCGDALDNDCDGEIDEDCAS